MLPRQLNIERRRKRIRHYTARRRQRSPFHRAFTYWWVTVLLCLILLALFAPITASFHLRSAEKPAAPARPSLRLVWASEEEVTTIVRAGNARRLATAMNDADIGISFAPRLPEPAPLPEAPLLAAGEVARAETAPRAVPLPPAAGEGRGANALLNPAPNCRLSAPLVEAAYAPADWQSGLPAKGGSARFWISLDEEGRPETVLRLAPTGTETPLLKALRLAILSGRGRRAAQGIITLTWHTKEEA